MIESRAIFPTDLEIRRRGRVLSGSFAYGKLATISDRGRVRKEVFLSHAFSFSVEAAEREINLLAGHSFDSPLASKLNGSLRLKDGADALRFEATLPAAADRPSWVEDTVRAVRAGMVGGISPGFRIPPKSAVPNAQRLVPEPGNEGVMIREISEANLYELSLVTRPAYDGTEVDLRHGQHVDAPPLLFFF